jgi:hypothetical protein
MDGRRRSSSQGKGNGMRAGYTVHVGYELGPRCDDDSVGPSHVPLNAPVSPSLCAAVSGKWSGTRNLSALAQDVKGDPIPVPRRGTLSLEDVFK